MKIYAPNKDATGFYASVFFAGGVGETDDPVLIEWFRKHGYGIPIEELPAACAHHAEEREFVQINQRVKDEASGERPNLEAMSASDLRDWMKENGYGNKIKNTRDKDKLLNLLEE